MTEPSPKDAAGTTVAITVNGEPQTVPAPTNVAALLERLQVPTVGGMAVLLNGEIARRADWAATPVNEGDELEIVRATVGG